MADAVQLLIDAAKEYLGKLEDSTSTNTIKPTATTLYPRTERKRKKKFVSKESLLKVLDSTIKLWELCPPASPWEGPSPHDNCLMFCQLMRPYLEELKQQMEESQSIDVKPWDDETDMKKLEEVVRNIEMPDLSIKNLSFLAKRRLLGNLLSCEDSSGMGVVTGIRVTPGITGSFDKAPGISGGKSIFRGLKPPDTFIHNISLRRGESPIQRGESPCCLVEKDRWFSSKRQVSLDP
ncbi:hypothetical protein V8G54_025122 [Vigna mungo]|uniref:Translation elongation factor EF1B beta/delta subunit guanine nucleotide exchange domain-containing protein n=1 Tax=Vigna mungo TaxID=3915 RepID=A0AAQ3N7Z9_VIGMU